MTLLFQLINDCNNIEQWLKEKVQQQESYPKNIDPILWSSNIKEASEHLRKYDAFPFCFPF
jgi:heat shock protein 4